MTAAAALPETLPAPALTPRERLAEWLAEPGNHLSVERPGARFLAVAYSTAEGRRVAWAWGWGDTPEAAVSALGDAFWLADDVRALRSEVQS